MGSEIHGKTLGVIGTGKLAPKLFQRAGLWHEGVSFDPFQRVLCTSARHRSDHTILRRADFITIHTADQRQAILQYQR